MNIVPATKRYVGDDRFRVRLFETIAEETRRVLLELDGKDVRRARTGPTTNSGGESESMTTPFQISAKPQG
jgi:hypothetical protein